MTVIWFQRKRQHKLVNYQCTYLLHEDFKIRCHLFHCIQVRATEQNRLKGFITTKRKYVMCLLENCLSSTTWAKSKFHLRCPSAHVAIFLRDYDIIFHQSGFIILFDNKYNRVYEKWLTKLSISPCDIKLSFTPERPQYYNYAGLWSSR